MGSLIGGSQTHHRQNNREAADEQCIPSTFGLSQRTSPFGVSNNQADALRRDSMRPPRPHWMQERSMGIPEEATKGCRTRPEVKVEGIFQKTSGKQNMALVPCSTPCV
jgi:hypothetical protein